jgi:3-hydroxyacyl-[acyl-carrier-protein] dehydratase
MPGVLMLQTLTEAGAWLLRVSDDFKYSMIVLREAKNVKFGHFVEPGRQLLVTVEATERSGHLATLKGKGEIEGNQAVSARLVLECYNLRDRDSSLETTDAKLTAHWRDLYCLLAGQKKTEQKLVH